MELINQEAKVLMEGCKIKARSSGLKFDNETLEYIVTNQNILRLSPKIMIPTMYDYWVHGIRVNQEQEMYKHYPSNPYETVINTRPAVSFYNDNNPDWLNVMIFYHVLGHIDFFQNNVFFKHTWDDDFMAIANSDKIVIDRIRRQLGEKKRYVDYVIEFIRALDNLVGYYKEMNKENEPQAQSKLDFFFGQFLRENSNSQKWIEFTNKYNEKIKTFGEKRGNKEFFHDIKSEFPEFEEFYKKYKKEYKGNEDLDIISFIMNHSDFLKKEENGWMKEVMEIVRRTSLYFQPQIRTKIINEGWASYWHQELFEKDPMLSTNEVIYSRVNSGVMTMPKVGLNPYALGYKLICFIEDLANKGKLWITDKVFNEERRSWIYYIKSKKGEDYRKMVIDGLYHPPHIEVGQKKDGTLYIEHMFEGQPLHTPYIDGVLRGTEFLWGQPVALETTEFEVDQNSVTKNQYDPTSPIKYKPIRVLYLMKNGKLARRVKN